MKKLFRRIGSDEWETYDDIWQILDNKGGMSVGGVGGGAFSRPFFTMADFPPSCHREEGQAGDKTSREKEEVEAVYPIRCKFVSPARIAFIKRPNLREISDGEREKMDPTSPYSLAPAIIMRDVKLRRVRHDVSEKISDNVSPPFQLDKF